MNNIIIETEIWKPIPNYSPYLISNKGNFTDGRIKITKEGNRKFIIMKGCIKDGRHRYSVHKVVKGKQIFGSVLVMMAFKNFIPCGYKKVIDHIDNDCLNDCLNNLQIITQRSNASKDTKNTSGYTGVSFKKHAQSYKAQILINNKLIYLGYNKEAKKASLLYQTALNNLDKYNKNNKEFRILINNLIKNK